MSKLLGRSVYLSSFDRQRETLPPGDGEVIFLSLHISEEFGPGYCERAEEVCRALTGAGYRVLADVSVKTMAQFGERDLAALAGRLGLWGLRIDYGLTEAEMTALAKRLPIALNASTVDLDAAQRIAGAGGRVMAMHNFYPRPETGLDEEYLRESTRALQAAGLEVLAFVPGDGEKRGPVHAGLPTLEAHRDALPSAAGADLLFHFGLDGVFVGDPGLGGREWERLRLLCRDGVVSLPVELEPDYVGLYGQTFTSRVDSPVWLVRLKESREYSCVGDRVEPKGGQPRPRGSLTVDNALYGRYSGELQLIRQNLPPDERVNVIGRVPENALQLLDSIPRGGKFTFVEP